MQTRTGKRILAVLLSAVIAAGTGDMVRAEEEAAVLAEEEGDVLPASEEFLDVNSSEEGEADIPEQETVPEISAAEIGIDSVEIVEEGAEGVLPEVRIFGEEAAGEDSLPDGMDQEDADDGITYLEEETLRSGNAQDGADSRIFMRSLQEYECCYGDQLTGESRGIYDELVSRWAGGGTGNITCYLAKPLPYNKENVSLVLHNIVQAAYDAFVYDYPEVFWLRSISVSSGHNSSDMLVSVHISGNERYTGAKSETAVFDQAVARETDRIKSLLPENADLYMTVKTIHDYICEMTAYDSDKKNYTEAKDTGEVFGTAHTAAGFFLKDRVVVCEGYAKTFKILCGKFGILCALLIGNTDSGPHMWNYVKMDDGKWYLVDTTWDDHTNGYGDTYLLAGSMSYGSAGRMIWNERQIYTDFSDAGAKNFVLPVLSTGRYEQTEHDWQEVSRTPATCRSYAEARYRCTICGAEKVEFVGPETAHDWGSYRSNNDATWMEDGTKTAVCQYGCGETKTVADVGSRLTARVKINLPTLCLRIGQSTDAVKVTLVRGDEVVSWKSNKKAVASVNSKGRITAGMKTGEAVITLTTLSGLKKKIHVAVQEEEVETTGIAGLSKNVTLEKGGKIQLSPVIEPVTSLQKVTYASSDKKVAAVTAKGVITAKKAGTAKITVKSGKKTFKVTVKVKKS